MRKKFKSNCYKTCVNAHIIHLFMIFQFLITNDSALGFLRLTLKCLVGINVSSLGLTDGVGI